MDVAVKTLRVDAMGHGEQEFMREAKIMVTLNHPCIVKLIGVSKGKPMMLVWSEEAVLINTHRIILFSAHPFYLIHTDSIKCAPILLNVHQFYLMFTHSILVSAHLFPLFVVYSVVYIGPGACSHGCPDRLPLRWEVPRPNQHHPQAVGCGDSLGHDLPGEQEVCAPRPGCQEYFGRI